MFVEELDENVRAANESLLALERVPDDAEQLRSLFRVMHTLKGASRSAGVLPVERLCHRLEAMLAAARDEGRPLTRPELDTLFAGVDRLAAAETTLRGGGAVSDDDADLTRTPSVPVMSPRPDVPPTVLPVDPVVPVAPAVPAVPAVPADHAEVVETPSRRSGPPRESAIRVGQDRVDALFSVANRLLILAARVETQPAEVEKLHDASVRAATAWKRMRRRIGPQSMTGGNEARIDLQAIDDALEELRKNSGRMLGDMLQSGRELAVLAADVSRGVRELRMRPFSDAVSDLPRIVRDVAAATGKQAELEITGESVQADRAVLSQIHDAMLHLVRNAVDHGIEMPAQRMAKGKPAHGIIRVAASLIGDRMVVTVRDDGAGLDIGTMRRELAARGEDVPGDDRAVARRLFLGGLTTRATATAISGRGVGLDAVRAVAERVRGSVDVSWVPGGGTTFTIEAPLTLATVRAVLARVGSTRVAVPSAFVDRLVRVDPVKLRSVEGRTALETRGAPVPVSSLAALLGPPLVDRAPEGTWSLMLLHVGERRVAVRVDELLEELEVVVRPIRAHGRSAVPHVSGAAMLAGGTVALVLNVTALVATALGLPADGATIAGPRDAGKPRRRIMVVDDSITTRTLESSVLEAAGYDVMTAVDGADGWRLLQERGADLVVSDVEMPRMDGLQLCETIRASSRFRALPVILVTALETPEHRARGLEIGADAYLGKSSFEQDALLTTVRDLLTSFHPELRTPRSPA
jgi:two-component system chemotaxis sensor kinase CheA